jgi:hypothetical protein
MELRDWFMRGDQRRQGEDVCRRRAIQPAQRLLAGAKLVNFEGGGNRLSIMGGLRRCITRD